MVCVLYCVYRYLLYVIHNVVSRPIEYIECSLFYSVYAGIYCMMGYIIYNIYSVVFIIVCIQVFTVC